MMPPSMIPEIQDDSLPGEAAILPRDYWCFISYRHTDNKQPGRQWASWLHHSLETYEVPEDLVGKKNARGDVIPERIFPVFRDEEELPADAELSKPIEAALLHSRFLVVLCSPQAVQSRFVGKEIIRFKQLHSADRILAALLEGEPNATENPALGGPERECFPEPLRFALGEDGELSSQPIEPIAADFRLEDGTLGWTTPGAYREALLAARPPSKRPREQVAAYQGKQHLMLLKIVAGVLGVPLGTLTQRDKAYQLAKQKRRTTVLRRWLGLVSLLGIGALASGIYARQQRDLAETQTAQAQAALRAETLALSRSHDAKGIELIASEEELPAGAYVAKAHRLLPEDATAWTQMFSLLTQPPPTLPLGQPMHLGGEMDDVPSVSAEGRHLIVQSAFGVKCFDLTTGQCVHQVGGTSSFWGGCFAAQSPGAIMAAPGGAKFEFFPGVPGLTAPEPFLTGAAAEQNEMPLLMSRMRLTDDARFAVLMQGGVSANGLGKLFGNLQQEAPDIMGMTLARDGSAPQELALGKESPKIIVTCPGHPLLATGDGKGTIRVLNLETGKSILKDATAHAVKAAAFTHDGRKLIAATADRTLHAYDLTSGQSSYAVKWPSDINTIQLTADGAFVLLGMDSGVGVASINTGYGMGNTNMQSSAVRSLLVDSNGQQWLLGNYANELVQVQSAGREKLQRVIAKLPELPTFVAQAAQPQTAVTFTEYGLGQIWPLAGDDLVKIIIQLGGGCRMLHWSPAGDALIVLTEGKDDEEDRWSVHWITFNDARPTVVSRTLSPEIIVNGAWSLTADTGVISCINGKVIRLTVGQGKMAFKSLTPAGVMTVSFLPAFAPQSRLLFNPVTDLNIVEELAGKIEAAEILNQQGVDMIEKMKQKVTTNLQQISAGGTEPPPVEWPSMKTNMQMTWTEEAGNLIVGISRDGQLDCLRREADQWIPVPVVMLDAPAIGQKSEVGFQGVLSTNGKSFALGTVNHRLRIFSVGAELRETHDLQHGKTISALAISPAGELVAIGDEDGGLRILSTVSGLDVSVGMQHQHQINSLDFSPDGRWLLSGSNDNEARLWESHIGRLAAVPMRMNADVNVAKFCPDGRTVALGLEDGSVAICAIGIHCEAPPAWVPEILENLAGFKLGEKGERVPIPIESLYTWRDRLPALADDTIWGRVAAGILGGDRKLAPQLGLPVSAEHVRLATEALDRKEWESAGLHARRARQLRPDVTLSPELSELQALMTVDPSKPNFQAESAHLAGEEWSLADGPALHWCPPGRYLAGSPNAEQGRNNNESQHYVALTDGFWMASTETTQAQWEHVMGESAKEHAQKMVQQGEQFHFNPQEVKQVTTVASYHHFTGAGDLEKWTGFFAEQAPMSFVSCADAESYCNQLTELALAAGQIPEGWIFRLPTEAEWEYACRAGTTTATYVGDLQLQGSSDAPVLNDIAWYSGNSSVDYTGNVIASDKWDERAFAGPFAGPHEVGRLKANAWGLHDLLGNLEEWCLDATEQKDFAQGFQLNPRSADGKSRVMRGGAWNSYARTGRAAARGWENERWCSYRLGFRVVLAAANKEESAAVSGVTPKPFYYMYNAQPEPGSRAWAPAESGIWTETYPSGTINRFAVLRSTTLYGKRGLQLCRQVQTGGMWKNEENFEVFFQLPNQDSPGLYFRERTNNIWQDWRKLGEIKKGVPP